MNDKFLFQRFKNSKSLLFLVNFKTKLNTKTVNL